MRHKSDACQRRWKNQKSRGPTTTTGFIFLLLFSFIYYLQNLEGHGPQAFTLPAPLLLFWEKRARLKRAWRALTSYRVVNHSHTSPTTHTLPFWAPKTGIISKLKVVPSTVLGWHCVN